MRHASTIALVALALVAPAGASAHGIDEPLSGATPLGDPGAQRPFGANYGLLVPDGEGIWRWTPEEATGATPRAWLEAAPGRVLVATDAGLMRTEDGGCSYTFVDGALEGPSITSMIAAPGGQIWLTSETPQRGDLWRSDDAGASWRAVGLGGEDVLMARVERGPDGVLWAQGFDRARRERVIWRGDGDTFEEVATGARLVGAGLIARPEATWELHDLRGPTPTSLTTLERAPVDARFQGERLLVRLEKDALVELAPGAQAPVELAFRARCLVVEEQVVWVCQRTTDADAHFVRRQTPGGAWEPVLSWEAILPADCPADSAAGPYMEPQWITLQTLGLGPPRQLPSEDLEPSGGCAQAAGTTPAAPVLVLTVVLVIMGARRRRDPPA